ncbi:MAG: hypothetical protein MI924_23950 [Chloroflexales bacterium]|nr:hypothetical protein [Chloroflexales bacterium]
MADWAPRQRPDRRRSGQRRSGCAKRRPVRRSEPAGWQHPAARGVNPPVPAAARDRQHGVWRSAATPARRLAPAPRAPSGRRAIRQADAHGPGAPVADRHAAHDHGPQRPQESAGPTDAAHAREGVHGTGLVIQIRWQHGHDRGRPGILAMGSQVRAWPGLRRMASQR